MKARTTKKAGNSRRKRIAEEGLAHEYGFDYSKSKPNRFARRVGRDAVVVVLDSDVAEVFHDPKQVNALLRATIAAVKKRRPRRTR
jgi:hypothetical protein